MKIIIKSFALVSTLLLTSCFHEQADQDLSVSEINNPSMGIEPECQWETICIEFLQTGHWVIVAPDSVTCVASNSQNCTIETEVCLPYYHKCLFPVKVWWWDVWEVADNIRHTELFSLFDVLGVEPRERMPAVFPVSDRIVGFQFGERPRNLTREGNYFVNTPLSLDREVVERLNLTNSTIPAGEYPMVYDRRHNTYNALLSVDTYPFALNTEVSYSDQQITNRSVADILGNTFNSARNARVQQLQYGYDILDPDHQRGTHLFTSNGQNLVMSVKGAGVSPFYPLVLDAPIRLDEEIARSLGIKSFVINPDSMYQFIDPDSNEITVTFFPPEGR